MRAPKPFSTRTEQFPDRAQNDEARSRSELARLLNAVPFLRGRLISVTLTAGTPLTVNHGLSAKAAFMVARHNYNGVGTAASVAEAADVYQSGLNPKTQMAVISGATCRLDLWFYPAASKVVDPATGQSV